MGCYLIADPAHVRELRAATTILEGFIQAPESGDLGIWIIPPGDLVFDENASDDLERARDSRYARLRGTVVVRLWVWDEAAPGEQALEGLLNDAVRWRQDFEDQNRLRNGDRAGQVCYRPIVVLAKAGARLSGSVARRLDELWAFEGGVPGYLMTGRLDTGRTALHASCVWPVPVAGLIAWLNLTSVQDGAVQEVPGWRSWRSIAWLPRISARAFRRVETQVREADQEQFTPGAGLDEIVKLFENSSYDAAKGAVAARIWEQVHEHPGNVCPQIIERLLQRLPGVPAEHALRSAAEIAAIGRAIRGRQQVAATTRKTLDGLIKILELARLKDLPVAAYLLTALVVVSALGWFGLAAQERMAALFRVTRFEEFLEAGLLVAAGVAGVLLGAFLAKRTQERRLKELKEQRDKAQNEADKALAALKEQWRQYESGRNQYNRWIDNRASLARSGGFLRRLGSAMNVVSAPLDEEFGPWRIGTMAPREGDGCATMRNSYCLLATQWVGDAELDELIVKHESAQTAARNSGRAYLEDWTRICAGDYENAGLIQARRVLKLQRLHQLGLSRRAHRLTLEAALDSDSRDSLRPDSISLSNFGLYSCQFTQPGAGAGGRPKERTLCFFPGRCAESEEFDLGEQYLNCLALTQHEIRLSFDDTPHADGTVSLRALDFDQARD